MLMLHFLMPWGYILPQRQNACEIKPTNEVCGSMVVRVIADGEMLCLLSTTWVNHLMLWLRTLSKIIVYISERGVTLAVNCDNFHNSVKFPEDIDLCSQNYKQYESLHHVRSQKDSHIEYVHHRVAYPVMCMCVCDQHHYSCSLV